MKCSCLWCNKEAVEGCISFSSKLPTCEEHSAKEIFKAMKKEFNKNSKPQYTIHEAN